MEYSQYTSGNIHLKRPSTIKRLRAIRINGIPTENLFTLTTQQTIKSNIYISKFHVGNIVANSINDHENFQDNIVIIGRDNVIECEWIRLRWNIPNFNWLLHIVFVHIFSCSCLAPIRIASCIVNGNLTLSEREDTKISRHIVGTRMDDLSQIYNGRVVIRGSLTVDNAVMSPIVGTFDASSPDLFNDIIIAGQPFDVPKLHEKYWMKNVNQVW